MSDLFILQMDTKDLKLLEKFFRKAPLLFAEATAGMLNNFAFGTRLTSIGVIHQKMTVRSTPFIRHIVRVNKANKNQPMNQQFSATGAIALPRFSGLVEQEVGTKTDRTRTATVLARSGSQKKKIKPAFRMKKSNKLLSWHDYPGKSAEHRTIVMLQTLFRKKYRKPFLITRKPGLPKGMYIIRKRKLHLLQSFEPRNLQPKRVRWLSTGTFRYFKGLDLRNLWRTQIEHVMKKRKKR